MHIFFNKKLLFISFFIIISISLVYRVNLIEYKINTSTDTPIEKRLGTTGYAIGHIKDTFDSWFYYDLYPVKKNVGITIQQEIVEEFIDNEGQRENKNIELIMRDGSSIFQGEFYRLHYALPNYLIFKQVSPKTSNIALSLLSIVFLMIFGLLKQRLIFSTCFSLLLIYSDFYIYENYINENIFGTSISIFIILFSIFNIFIDSIKKYYIGWFIFFGFIVSFFSNIRTEFIFLLISLSVLCFFNFNKKKLILSLTILVISFLIFQNLLNKNFENKIDKTNLLIVSHNGIEYTGPVGSGHTFWHPFWMGLGDNINGQKLGFNWGDKAAYDYAAGINPQLFTADDIDSHRLFNSYDEYGIYQIKPELIPEYQKTLRDDVVRKFFDNKYEFFLIYKNKLTNILTKIQSIDIGIPTPLNPNRGYHDNIVINGINILIIGVLLLIICIVTSFKSSKNIFSTRFKSYWSFIFSSLPLALPAVIVSDMGATYVSIFHFALIIFTLEFLVKKLCKFN